MCDGHTPQLVPDLIDLTPGWCWRQSINVEQGRFRVDGQRPYENYFTSRRSGTMGQLTTACWRQAADSIRQPCASSDAYAGKALLV